MSTLSTRSGVGVACPVCASSKSSTIDSREDTAFGVPSRRRRRKCECGHTYSTFEMSDAVFDLLFDKVHLANTMQEALEAVNELDEATLAKLTSLTLVLQNIVRGRNKKMKLNLNDNPAFRRPGPRPTRF